MAARRKLNAGRNGGFENVEATSRFNLFEEGEAPSAWNLYWSRFFSFSGMYVSPSWAMILWAGFRETFGSALIGAIVSIVAFFALGLNVLLGGLLIAAAYGGAYYLASRLPADDSLRGHYNGAITVGYLFTSRIGLLGAIFYGTCQLTGAVLGGGIAAGLLAQYDVAIAPIVQATVPLPTTTITSVTSTICLELFGTLIIVLVLLLSEFVGTDPKTPVQNYKVATYNAAIALFILVIIGFPFQTYTYSNTSYMGALLANMNRPFVGRDINDLAQLCNSTMHTNSIFGSSGTGLCNAWVHYFFTPLAGGLFAGLFALALFLMRYPTALVLTLETTSSSPVARTDSGNRHPQEGETLRHQLVPSSVQQPLASSFHKTK